MHLDPQPPELDPDDIEVRAAIQVSAVFSALGPPLDVSDPRASGADWRKRAAAFRKFLLGLSPEQLERFTDHLADAMANDAERTASSWRR